MNGSLRSLHIALNIGGIIASLIGIVCVVKVAFIKPWQLNIAQAASAAASATVTSKEVSGRFAPEVLAVPAPPKEVAPIVPQTEVQVTVIPQPQAGAAETPPPSAVLVATNPLQTIDPLPASVDPTVPETVMGMSSPSIYERLKARQIQPDEVGSPKGFGSSQVATAPVPVVNQGATIVAGTGFSSASAVVSPPALNDSPKEIDFAPPKNDGLVINGSGLRGHLATELVKTYLQKLGYLNPRTETGPGERKIKAQSNAAKFSEEICVILRDAEEVANQEPANQAVTVGYEGGAVIVHPYNRLNELTLEQVAEIFSGKTKDWTTFGKSTKMIQVCVCNGEMGGVGLLEELVLKPAMLDFCVDNRVVACNTVAEVASYVAANPNAIGLVPFNFSAPDVKFVPIKAAADCLAIMPGRFTVDTYALGRPIRVFPATQSHDFSAQFLKFLFDREGQELLGRAGVPIEGLINEQVVASHSAFYKSLMEDEKVLPSYKNMIRGLNRLNSPFNLLFQNGEMVLTAESELRLKRVSSWFSSQGGELRVAVIGFSDSVGPFKDNQALSRQRADVVKDWFLKNGVPNVKSFGYGEEMLVSENGTEAGRSTNRRVEVWIGK